MDFTLELLDTTESTQDVIRDLAGNGEREGIAVMAIRQTRGRGREGHAWISPPGKNLALSILLRPRLKLPEAALMGLLAGVAVAETLAGMQVPHPGLKWPNDVLVNDKKIAGILSEAAINRSCLQYVILGIGVNVNSEGSDFPPEIATTATSVALCTGRMWDIQEVALKLLEAIKTLYERLPYEEFGFVREMWRTRWLHEGLLMRWGEKTGQAVGINELGALILKTPTGGTEVIVAGDVFPAYPQENPRSL